MNNGHGLDIKPEYHTLATCIATRLLQDHPGAANERLVIGIAGESGSGKSITATCLSRDLGPRGLRTSIIHQDNYFFRPPRTNHEHRLGDLTQVGPQEVDLDLIAAHIAAFRAGAAHVEGPQVDYPGNRFVKQTFDFSTCNVLIVEGTYVLDLTQVDVRIFLTATHEDTRDRRRERNRDIDAPVINDILAIEHRLIAPQRRRADIVIDRHFAISRPG